MSINRRDFLKTASLAACANGALSVSTAAASCTSSAQRGVVGITAPELARADVLVVGSGPAGVAAALASARTGADTLLIERYGCLGGALSVSNVQSYGFSVNKYPGVLSGIPREIEDRCRSLGVGKPDYRGCGIFVEPDGWKCLLDDWMAEAGVRVLLHCQVIGSILEGSALRGVAVHTKSGPRTILAKCTVDATGDGDVAYFAGADFEIRPRKNLQPVTVVFGVDGVDLGKFHAGRKNGGSLTKVFSAAAKAGEWKSSKRGGAWKITRPGGSITSFNIVKSVSIDATDVNDLTKAETEGRRQVREAIAVLRKYGSDLGFANCELRSLAPQLGVRETRRIVGDYRMTEEDVLDARDFPDGIGRFVGFMDGFGTFKMSKVSPTSSAPYRILLPRGLENLLVAGRCVSCDPESFGALRLMPCCAMTGQAAGTAAALSVKSGATPRGLDVATLRRKLVAAGVRLDRDDA